MDDIQVGDKVVIVQSPYLDVRAGTVALVTRIKRNHAGPGRHLYYLDLPDHKLFWKYSIKKVEE